MGKRLSTLSDVKKTKYKPIGLYLLNKRIQPSAIVERVCILAMGHGYGVYRCVTILNMLRLEAITWLRNVLDTIWPSVHYNTLYLVITSHERSMCMYCMNIFLLPTLLSSFNLALIWLSCQNFHCEYVPIRLLEIY